jgi:hypothetical protein
MARRPPGDEAERQRKRRRARDTAEWRSRKDRCVSLHQIEAGAFEYDLAIRFAGLKESQLTNKAALNAGLGKLLRLGLAALILQEETKRRR